MPPVVRPLLIAGLTLALTPLAFAQPSAPPDPATTAARIDQAIEKELRAAGVPIAPPASDEDFLRRTSLDLTGRVPSPSQVTLFSLRPSETKRADLVDGLLDSDRFGKNWGRYFRDVLFSRITEQRALISRTGFEQWMAEQLNAGTTWDEIATELITASGDVREDARTALLMAQGAEASEVAAEVSRVFLGVQIQCANCHDHTTDRWKREDFHTLAAFFPRLRLQPVNTDGRRTFEIVARDFQPQQRRYDRSQLSRMLFVRFDRNRDGKLTKAELKDSPLNRNIDRIFQFGDSDQDGALTKEEVANLPDAPMQNRNTDVEHYMPNLDDPGSKGELMTPGFFLTGESLKPGTRDADRRSELARMITDKENVWFSKALVNRVWGELLGEGFVTPVDDLGPDREEMYPEAFAILSEGFTRSGYDVKWLFATILRTEAYQRSASFAGEPELAFAAAAPTRLRADQIFDALGEVLNVNLDGDTSRFGRGNAYGNRFSPRGRFDMVFAHDPSTPQDEITSTIPQALFMMNSPLLANQVQATGNTRLANLLRDYDDDTDAVSELYLTVLSREPTKRELAICLEHVGHASSRGEAYEDLMWSLLNSTEFLTKR